MAGKPRRSGGKAAPFDYTDPEEAVLPDIPTVPEIRSTGKRLTPAAVEEMARLVSCGVPVPTAATAVGAGYSAKHWAKKAREHREAGREPGWGEGQSPELEWLERMEQSKAQLEANAVVAVYLAGSVGSAGDWKALAWLMERRASKRYHLQSKLLVEAKDGAKVEVTTMSTEKLIALARGLLPEEDIVVKPASLPSGQTPAEAVDAEFDD